VYRRNNLLLIDRQLFELEAPGSCHEGKDAQGTYVICVKQLLPGLDQTNGLAMDSVYVFEKTRKPVPSDSSSWWFYISAKSNVVVKKEKRTKAGIILRSESLAAPEKQ